MQKDNRIIFPIPEDTLVEKGFRHRLIPFEASPGDMIVENINNAPGSRFICMCRIPDLPGPYPFKGLTAKYFRTLGARTEREYLVCVTDEGILTETGGEIMGDDTVGYRMTGDNVERTVICYRDFHVRQCEISDFLRRFIQ